LQIFQAEFSLGVMQAMTAFFRFIEHHGWLVFVAVTCLNALILKLHSRRYIRQQPELADGYGRLIRGVLFWGNLPWLVMGAGIELGGLPGMFSYFHPRDGHPFVLAWFGVVITIWILGFWWLFARGGAEFLVEHPGLLRGPPCSPTAIRIYYCLCIIGGICGVVFLFVADIPHFPE
jgi:hypothetical protein